MPGHAVAARTLPSGRPRLKGDPLAQHYRDVSYRTRLTLAQTSARARQMYGEGTRAMSRGHSEVALVPPWPCASIPLYAAHGRYVPELI
jgi:hypothetical protein